MITGVNTNAVPQGASARAARMHEANAAKPLAVPERIRGILPLIFLLVVIAGLKAKCPKGWVVAGLCMLGVLVSSIMAGVTIN